MEELLSREISGTSTITYKGSLQGFNIANFTLLYLVGAYLRFNDVPKFLEKKWMQVTSIVAVVSVIFVWSVVTDKLTRFELRSAWVYHNTLVILLSALLFNLFRSFSFRSRLVNELAGASFTCFLIHGYLLDDMGIEKAATGNILIMLGHILLVTVSCYIISYIVYVFYRFATGWFFKVLSKKVPLFQPREII